MSQFLVVRCYSCENFQVHQIRKDHKFTCKVCGLKQSRRKVYAQGIASECRKAVQHFNVVSHENSDTSHLIQSCSSYTSVNDQKDAATRVNPSSCSGVSKWDVYLPTPESTSSDPSIMLFPSQKDKQDKHPTPRVEFGDLVVEPSKGHDGLVTQTKNSSKGFSTGELKLTQESSHSSSLSSVKKAAFQKFGDVDDTFLYDLDI